MAKIKLNAVFDPETIQLMKASLEGSNSGAWMPTTTRAPLVPDGPIAPRHEVGGDRDLLHLLTAVLGTKLPIRDVRRIAAMGWKAASASLGAEPGVLDEHRVMVREPAVPSNRV
jgi:hypothetical protein